MLVTQGPHTMATRLGTGVVAGVSAGPSLDSELGCSHNPLSERQVR